MVQILAKVEMSLLLPFIFMPQHVIQYLHSDALNRINHLTKRCIAYIN